MAPQMPTTLIPACLLLAVTVFGVLGLRRFSYRVRIGFDAACFVAVGALLFSQHVSPVFAAPKGPLDSAGLWFRAIAGAWWVLGARLFVGVSWFVLHRNRRSEQARLFSDLTAAGVYIATALIVLNSVFALPVTGVVATSGVFAIVLGLALQNTLADVFAGIAVGIEAPFTVGHRIRIADRLEGLIIQVNWRSIHLQTDGEDVAIIPHSLIAKAEITNRSFPTLRRNATVELVCPSRSAPERVIMALVEAALLCHDVLKAPAPTATLIHLGERWNGYAISFYVEDTKRLSATKSTLLLLARRQLYYAGLLNAPHYVEQPMALRSLAPSRVLQEMVLFERLSDEQLRQLTPHLRPILLEPGEILFHQDVADETLYMVTMGVLDFTRRHGSAKNVAVGAIGGGEYVGEIGLLTGAPHAATATARTHTQVLALSKEALAPLLAKSPELAAAFEKSVRRGLELIERQDAVHATADVDTKGPLLARIRSFFQS